MNKISKLVLSGVFALSVVACIMPSQETAKKKVTPTEDLSNVDRAIPAKGVSTHPKICHATGNGNFIVIAPSQTGVDNGHFPQHTKDVYADASGNCPAKESDVALACKPLFTVAAAPAKDNGVSTHPIICHQLANGKDGRFIKIAPSKTGIANGHFPQHELDVLADASGRCPGEAVTTCPPPPVEPPAPEATPTPVASVTPASTPTPAPTTVPSDNGGGGV